MKPTAKLLSYPKESLEMDTTKLTILLIPQILTKMKTLRMEQGRNGKTLKIGNGKEMIMRPKWNGMA
jgi:hypothetical protein